MKKLILSIALLMPLIGVVVGCSSDDSTTSTDYWNDYADWREENTEWFALMRDSLDADGRLFYNVVFPRWNPSAEILVHYFNDRALTADNLQPMLTSTCSVRYIGFMKNGTPIDSSYNDNTYGPAIRRFTPDAVIQGWAIALMDMHVGDSCEIVIPYPLAYGGQPAGDVLPYSALRFRMRLVDIPYWEIRP